MKPLITSAEIAVLAFGGEENVRSELLSDAAIVSAQQKFLKPVLGGLYDAVDKGSYPDLLKDYIKPALAHWVKYLVLPSISVQIGALGVVRYQGRGFDSADEKSLASLRRHVKCGAEALTCAMIEHIESSPDEYFQYAPDDNIKHTICISGGVVL